MDQTIRAALSELGIKFSDESLRDGFYSIVTANGETGRRKVVANGRTMNRTIIGVMAIRLRVMIVPVRRNRAVMVAG